jgi:hypothetical protein
LDNHTKLLFIVEIKIMKLNFLKYFLAGALTVGFMTFAAGPARAGTVIGGQLYAPLSLKLVFTYYDSTGKFKKLTVSTKDVLVALGYGKKDQLARGPGGDVYVLDQNTIVSDLSASGFLTENLNRLVYNETSHSNGGVVLLNSAFNYSEAGVLDLKVYDNPQVDEVTNVISAGVTNITSVLDPAGSRLASSFWFEVSGAYTRTGQDSAIKNNQQSVKETIKSPALSGSGFDPDVTSANENNRPPLPVSGSVSGSGSGKVLVAE